MSEQHTRHPIQVTVNGVARSGLAESRMLLSDFIRHELGATGTHVGCEHGVCGACTVQIDGVATRSCLCLARQVDGCDLRTVEGLGNQDGTLGVLQQAFKKHHALQCGFCTAGILMSCVDFLRRFTSPTEEQVRDMLSGHLCRCTGYTPIVEAILEVANQLKTEKAETSHA